MSPYLRQQAETLNAAEGISVVGNESTGVYVTDIHAGDSMRVANVDFGSEGAQSITIRVAVKSNNGTLVVRQDNTKGKILAKIKIEATGGENVWEERTFELTNTATGIHDVHFSFIGTGDATLFNWDWWQFNGATSSGIENLQDKASLHNTTFYTLQGIPAENPTQGIYIKDGKKVVINN